MIRSISFSQYVLYFLTLSVDCFRRNLSILGRLVFQGDWIQGFDLGRPDPPPFVVWNKSVHPGPVWNVRPPCERQKTDKYQRRSTARESDWRNFHQSVRVRLIGQFGTIAVENVGRYRHCDIHGKPGQRQPGLVFVPDQTSETSRLDKKDSGEPQTRDTEKAWSIDGHRHVGERVKMF